MAGFRPRGSRKCTMSLSPPSTPPPRATYPPLPAILWCGRPSLDTTASASSSGALSARSRLTAAAAQRVCHRPAPRRGAGFPDGSPLTCLTGFVSIASSEPSPTLSIPAPPRAVVDGQPKSRLWRACAQLRQWKGVKHDSPYPYQFIQPGGLLTARTCR